MAVLLHKANSRKTNHNKSLSTKMQVSRRPAICNSQTTQCAKALLCACPGGSFTVEAAFAIPVFLFAAVIVLGLFTMLQVQIQVTGGLQYASRTLAASCTDTEDDTQELLSLTEGRILLEQYLKEHDCRSDVIKGGTAGISLLKSDFSGDYVTLRASYRIKLPVSFWNIKELQVNQCVRSRKWTGANPDGILAEEGYVYVTPAGSAYHSSTACSYLDLSIRSVSVSQLQTLRNHSGGIYYACSCYEEGNMSAYITDYGTKYHGDLNCSGLKRTVYRIKREDVGDRHPCRKCYGG